MSLRSLRSALLGVPEFAEKLGTSGLPWRNLPIADGGIPSDAFERQWVSAGEAARSCLKPGSLVVIHCRAGLGRTGTIAARLLVELGLEPRAAIDLVRKTRAHTIETQAQERYVESLRGHD